MRFDNTFIGQFLISPGSASPRDGTLTTILHSVTLEVFPGLPKIDVVDQTGRAIGALLGVVVDLDLATVVSHTVVLPFVAGAETNWDTAVEEHIYRFAGSFIFLLATATVRRVYLDANGSMSLVFDEERGIAAATTGLLLSNVEYEEHFRADLHAAFGVDRDGWFTAGLTAHKGVRRLLCNHYLNLDTSQPVRHWPITPALPAGDPSIPIAEINWVVRRTVQALRAAGPVSVSLTAGNETRALLACLRDILPELMFVTIDAPGYQLDLIRSKELAKIFNLNHHVLPYKLATQNQMEEWEYRSSHCITGNNMSGHPSVASLAGQYFVGGLGGEVGRGFLWLNSDCNTPIDAQSIVDRLKLPDHPVILSEVEAWLTALPAYDSLFILDLAYMELRMSCWAFAQTYALPTVVTLHPLISRKSYKAMMTLSPEIRRNNGMIRLIIEDAWPDVMALPINRYGDFRDHLIPLQKAIRSPSRALRKARQLLKSGWLKGRATTTRQ